MRWIWVALRRLRGSWVQQLTRVAVEVLSRYIVCTHTAQGPCRSSLPLWRRLTASSVSLLHVNNSPLFCHSRSTDLIPEHRTVTDTFTLLRTLNPRAALWHKTVTKTPCPSLQLYHAPRQSCSYYQCSENYDFHLLRKGSLGKKICRPNLQCTQSVSRSGMIGKEKGNVSSFFFLFLVLSSPVDTGIAESLCGARYGHYSVNYHFVLLLNRPTQPPSPIQPRPPPRSPATHPPFLLTPTKII